MTPVRIVHIANKDGVTYSLPVAERELFPSGRTRVFLGGRSTASLNREDITALASLLTGLPVDTEFEVSFEDIGPGF